MRTFTLLSLVVSGLLCVPTAYAQRDPVADLDAAMKAADNAACIEACKSLSRVGETAKSAVPNLVKILETTTDAETRRCAALALGAMGPAAAEAVPALTKIISSDDASPADRAYAAHVLGEIGPVAASAAVPLLKLVTDGNLAVRREGAMPLIVLTRPQRSYWRTLARFWMRQSRRTRQPL